MLKAISDPLFSESPDGKPVPYLLESIEHNDDYTEWTMHVRDGIKFHDGEALTGDAVKLNIQSCQYSPLTGAALSAIDQVTASGQDVTITTKGPWVALPSYFVDYVPCGFMFSPKWLSSLEDLPQRDPENPGYDAALAATPAGGDALAPVGLGAFKYESFTPGNGNGMKTVRNDAYWRGPDGITGEDLPYLDGIDFVVAVDEDSRQNSVRSGTFDLMMTANGDTISQFLDDDAFKVDATTKFGDTGYIMLNTAIGDADPEGKNAASPLLNVNCRRALAGAIDKERFSEERTAGLAPPADGPFPPGSLGYLEDSGLPKFDVDAAQGRHGEVPGRAEDGPHRVQLQHDERPVQRRVELADHLDVDRSVRRSGQGHHHADRAGPVHRPRPQRLLPGARLAQPLRRRSRRAAAVVAERVGVADRRAGTELRPLQGPRDRQGVRHDQEQPRPGRPQGRGRGHQPRVRRRRCGTSG